MLRALVMFSWNLIELLGCLTGRIDISKGKTFDARKLGITSSMISGPTQYVLKLLQDKGKALLIPHVLSQGSSCSGLYNITLLLPLLLLFPVHDKDGHWFPCKFISLYPDSVINRCSFNLCNQFIILGWS